VARGKGGRRQPANPAPVSTPGSGRRTDGGAGSERQPLRLAPGQPHGARAEMAAAQQAAPMQAGAEAVSGTPAPSGPPAPPPLPEGGIFGPSMQPDMPIRIAGTSVEPIDAATVIRVLYSKRPTPWLARLLNGSR
jgi:hypothetical protein